MTTPPLMKLKALWKRNTYTLERLPITFTSHVETPGETRCGDNHTLFISAVFASASGNTLMLKVFHTIPRTDPRILEVHIPDEASVSMYRDSFTIACG